MFELSCCIHIFQEHENHTTNRKCWKYYSHLVSEQVFWSIQLKKFIILQNLDCKLIFNKCKNVWILVLLYFISILYACVWVLYNSKQKSEKGNFPKRSEKRRQQNPPQSGRAHCIENTVCFAVTLLTWKINVLLVDIIIITINITFIMNMVNYKFDKKKLLDTNCNVVYDTNIGV